MLCKTVLAAVFLLSLPTQLFGTTGYILSPRDTAPAPEVHSYAPELDQAYILMYQGEHLELYLRQDRGIFAFKDLRNDYIWKSGLDLPFNVEIRDLVFQGIDPAELPPLEERLNTTFIGIANSLLTIEYFDGANNIRRVGSAAQRNVERSFREIQQESGWAGEFSIDFQDIDLQILLEVELSDDELIFRVPDSGITGPGQARLASINVMPFLGASGGRQQLWDDEWQDFSISVPKPAPTGYVLVPDGSGALIRFRDNSVRFSEYRGRVYGQDSSQADMYYSFSDFSVAPKNNFLPLFGIVHGQRQNAFASYAVSGDEHLEIVAFPEENTTFYTHAYPRFVYNRLYYQVYNQRGDGYYRIFAERNRFDLDMRYRFLQGEGTHTSTGNLPADYSGIAHIYREYLENSAQLRAQQPDRHISGDIPLRIDFIMADVSKGIVGHRHQVTTTITDVQEIISDLQREGIYNLSSGLIGYARGGTVFSSPGRLRLLNALGRRSEWAEIISSLLEQDVDISFSRNFVRVAEGQIIPWGNVIRAASGWYTERWTNQANAPVNKFYFAKAERTASWLKSEATLMADLGLDSVSIDGMGHLLVSDYPPDKPISRADTIQIYQSALAGLAGQMQLNLVQPNQYLWKYTDRFLQMPVFSSQYLLQTDTVPLLQMILQGSIDMFAPYSNFSFSSSQDVLRMIDYNVYPSFLISKESSHALLLTNSADFYSTEYDNYREIILDVYGKVNSVLREVMGARWLERIVLAPGIILNTYDNGAAIVINYTQNDFLYEDKVLSPESARVFRNGGTE